MSRNIKKFSFGRNWSDYVDNFLNESALETAKKSLLKYLKESDFKNKTLIDIGCGSGIFSLSALRLGCKKVVSFDVDTYSVEATKKVKKRFGHLVPQQNTWEVYENSVLDDNVVNNLSNSADIVYSWGVLHHTGEMYKAISNASSIVKDKGYFIIAIYNKTSSSNFWLKVKKIYNNSPLFIKKSMIYPLYVYILLQRARYNLNQRIRKQPAEPLFSRERGMSIFYDLIDWVGGYPYEFATFDEIKDFVEEKGFKLIKAAVELPSPSPKFFNRFSFSYTGNNEFVFQKEA